MKKHVAAFMACLLVFLASTFATGQIDALHVKLMKFPLYGATSAIKKAVDSTEWNFGVVSSDGAYFKDSTGNLYRVLTTAPTVALTAGATVNIAPTTSYTFTLTPGEDETINATAIPPPGAMVNLIITTSGTTSRTLTFSTGFKTTGTLATGTTSAKVFQIGFTSTGSALVERSRTTAM